MKDYRSMPGEPRRQLILATVQNRPGLTFRGIVRATAIAAGTAAHHIRILKRDGRLHEVPHRGTRLFFPMALAGAVQGRAILFAAPILVGLYDWVAANPGVRQRNVLEHAATWGWQRSTTQHRLGRLVAAGLVVERREGRYCRYTAVQPTSLPLITRLGAIVAQAKAGTTSPITMRMESSSVGVVA